MPIDPLPQIAQRYQVPEPKVRELYGILQKTGGQQAQFTCEQLGGPVQWMPGMIMVTRWNDHQLKTRVDGLCSEIAAIVQGSESSAPDALRKPGKDGELSSCSIGESWWPSHFGHPSTCGDQNGIRYAYFPEIKRLLIQQGARIDQYDTADHHLTGVSQQQGMTRTLTFSSEEGPVDIKSLKCIPIDGA